MWGCDGQQGAQGSSATSSTLVVATLATPEHTERLLAVPRSLKYRVCMLLWHVPCRDSHIKQIYAAMRCFMSDFWQHAEGECAASSTKALQAQLDDVTAEGHQYRTAPRCLHLIGGTGARICLVHSPKGDMFFSDNPQVCWLVEQPAEVSPQ